MLFYLRRNAILHTLHLSLPIAGNGHTPTVLYLYYFIPAPSWGILLILKPPATFLL